MFISSKILIDNITYTLYKFFLFKQFYVCITDDEILKEANNCKKQNTNLSLAKFVNSSKPLIFKVGPLNEGLNEKKESNNNYALLVYVKVGDFQTFFDNDDPTKEIDKSKINLSDKECVFIHRKFNDDFDTDKNIANKKLSYWFATNNDSLIKPDCLIKYEVENIDDKTCKNCKSLSNDLKYCINDDIYLCLKCDEEIHNGTKVAFNSLKKHKRISSMQFSILHQNICLYDNHEKPYEIYCEECEELFCIKCLSNNVHNINHERKSSIIYINDGLLDKIFIEQDRVN